MIPFPFNESRFSFFVADYLLVGQLCTNPKSDRSLLSCRKVTQCSMNERDRRCAAVQLMHSNYPSYNNVTIASTLKMQIWTATNNSDVPRVMKTKFPAMVMVFGVVSSECHNMPPHIFEVGLKVNTWVCWRVWWSPGAIRWPVADPGCSSRTWHWPTSPKRPRLSFRRSATTLYPSPPIWTHWTTSFGHTLRSSPTWPPTMPKPAWSPPYAEYSLSSRRRLWKWHDPNSRSVSRQWLRLKRLHWIDVSSTT